MLIVTVCVVRHSVIIKVYYQMLFQRCQNLQYTVGETGFKIIKHRL